MDRQADRQTDGRTDLRQTRDKNIPKLSNGPSTIFNDRERPVTHISMLRQ